MNKTDMISKENLASMNRCNIKDVCCLNCRFNNFATIDLDRKTVTCMYFKQKMLTQSYCSHFTKRISIGE